MFLAVAAAALLATIALSPTRSARAESADLWLGIREVACAADGVDAYFAIPPLTEGSYAAGRLGFAVTPSATYVDLSLFDNNFAPNTFLGSVAQPSSAQPVMLRWSGLLPASMHYYRVNSLVGTQWREVERGAFETPDCYTVQRLACDPALTSNRIIVTFRIPYPGILEHAGPVETWLDLSTMSNSFAAGTFVGAGPFPVRSVAAADVFGRLFEWKDIPIGWRHYWRTNTHGLRRGTTPAMLRASRRIERQIRKHSHAIVIVAATSLNLRHAG